MFVVEGKSVTPLNQVSADIRTDRTQRLKQVLSPVPIIPSKRNIEIAGAKATRRINSEHPEFYLREPPPDPNAVSAIRKSSRPGETGPEIELVRLTVKRRKAANRIDSKPVWARYFGRSEFYFDATMGRGEGRLSFYAQPGSSERGICVRRDSAGRREPVRMGFWRGSKERRGVGRKTLKRLRLKDVD